MLLAGNIVAYPAPDRNYVSEVDGGRLPAVHLKIKSMVKIRMSYLVAGC